MKVARPVLNGGNEETYPQGNAPCSSPTLPCATTGLSLIAVWCLIGATPRGQPWTPAVTLPHVRYGLSVRRMAVLCPFSRPSMYRHVHRQLLRNKLPNFTTIVPVTVYHQGSYVETYSRSMPHPSCKFIPIKPSVARV
jgi:hypothetical protein